MTGPFTNLITRKMIRTKALEAGEYEDGVYDRHIVTYWDQERYSRAHLAGVGAGGLGSIYWDNIVRMGPGQIEITDGDDVELSNLSRQRFYPNQIGQNKALSAIDNLKPECTGNTTLIGYPYFFPNLLEEYPFAFSTAEILACLVDNEAVKYEAVEFGLKHGIPVIFAGISTSNRLAAVFVQEPEGPCYNCVYPKTELEAPDERYLCKYPGVIYSHTAIIGIAVYATIARIMNWETYWNEYILSLDTSSLTYKHKKRDSCELCSGGD